MNWLQLAPYAYDIDGDWREPPGQLAGAILSGDKTRRYLLWRVWSLDRPRLLFLMLNPSTADGRHDDPTVHRCRNFAARENCGGFEIVNLISIRETNPDLLNGDQQEPEEADEIIVSAIARCRRIVFAWGSLQGLSRAARQFAKTRAVQLVWRVTLANRRPECFNYCANGMPVHPLYQRADQPLIPWIADRGTDIGQMLAASTGDEVTHRCSPDALCVRCGGHGSVQSTDVVCAPGDGDGETDCPDCDGDI